MVFYVKKGFSQVNTQKKKVPLTLVVAWTPRFAWKVSPLTWLLIVVMHDCSCLWKSGIYTFCIGTDIPICLREQALKKSIATVFRRLWLKNLYYHLLSTLFVKDNLGMESCLTDSSWYDKVLNSSCLLFYKKGLALISNRIGYMGNLTAQCTIHPYAWRPSSTYSLTPKKKRLINKHDKLHQRKKKKEGTPINTFCRIQIFTATKRNETFFCKDVKYLTWFLSSYNNNVNKKNY